MNYSECHIYCDASVAIFTSMLLFILASKYTDYFREQIKGKNVTESKWIKNNCNCAHSHILYYIK